MITDSILLIISLLGLISGIIVAHLSKEELSVCRRYFPYALGLLLALILFMSVNVLYASAAVIVLILIILFYPKLLFYLYPAIFLFYFISHEKLIVAGLIYLYGLPVGSMLYLTLLKVEKDYGDNQASKNRALSHVK